MYVWSGESQETRAGSEEKDRILSTYHYSADQLCLLLSGWSWFGLTVVSMADLCLFSTTAVASVKVTDLAIFVILSSICLVSLFPLNQDESQVLLFLPLWCLQETHSYWTCWPISDALLLPNLFGPLSVRSESVTHPVLPFLSPLSPTQELQAFSFIWKIFLCICEKYTALWYQHVPVLLCMT